LRHGEGHIEQSKTESDDDQHDVRITRCGIYPSQQIPAR
jgi:hypothetical protein